MKPGRPRRSRDEFADQLDTDTDEGELSGKTTLHARVGAVAACVDEEKLLGLGVFGHPLLIERFGETRAAQLQIGELIRKIALPETQRERLRRDPELLGTAFGAQHVLLRTSRDAKRNTMLQALHLLRQSLQIKGADAALNAALEAKKLSMGSQEMIARSLIKAVIQGETSGQNVPAIRNTVWKVCHHIVQRHMENSPERDEAREIVRLEIVRAVAHELHFVMGWLTEM